MTAKRSALCRGPRTGVVVQTNDPDGNDMINNLESGDRTSTVVTNAGNLDVICGRAAGFTLIELMVTVAIIAILSAIALPNYQNYVIRGKIPDGTTALADTRVKLEQYFQDSPTHVYTGFTCPGDTKYFAITCDVSDSAYTVTATGQASAGMGSFVYTIDQDNKKATTGVPAGWTANGKCWVTGSSGSC
jgi:type IV pilus assembly protein PilE